MQRVWYWLIKPHPSFVDEDLQRRAQLLAAMIVAVLPLIILVGILMMPLLSGADPIWSGATFFPASSAIIMSVISYVLVRLGRYDAAAALYIVMFVAAPLGATILDASPFNMPIATLSIGGVLIANILSSKRAVGLLAAVAATGGLLAIPLLLPGSTFISIAGVLGSSITLSVLILLFSYYRDWLERQRHALLSTLNENLESLVQERTSELAEANETLKALARVKDDFIGNMSHELRTPITNIKLYHSLLAEGSPTKFESRLETLQRETHRLEQLVEGLLYLARLDHDQQMFHMTDVKLHDLIQDLVIDRMLQAASQGITVSLELEDQMPEVYGEPNELSQVFSILLSNAMNYTPVGGQITIESAVRSKDDQQWATVCVSDTGPGIPPGDLPHIFDRFYRGQTGKASSVSGSGLGLAIAKEIVHHHRGHIDVRSEGQPAKGAEFTVWIPLTIM